MCLYMCMQMQSGGCGVKLTQPGNWEPAPKNFKSQSEQMVAAPKQLGVIPGSSSQSSHNAQGFKEPIWPRRRPAGPYKYCIGAPWAPEKSFSGTVWRVCIRWFREKVPERFVDYR